MSRLLLFFTGLFFVSLFAVEAAAQFPKAQTKITDTAASRGYYFFVPYLMQKRHSGDGAYQLIVDEKGNTVYYCKRASGSDFKLQANGLISFFDRGKFFIADQQFRLLDSVACVNGTGTDSHDFLILPDGHYLLIGTDTETVDLGAYAIFMQRGVPGSKRARVKRDVIQELDAEKKLVRQWDFKNDFRIEDVDPVYLTDTALTGFAHFNSLALDARGDILVSTRYSNEVFKVSRSTGALLWRLGGKNNQFRFLNDTVPFLGQHDARLTADGKLTLFDNGYSTEAKCHNARALEYELDEVNKTARLSWSYSHPQPLISEATGNMQRLDNGNTLVNFGKVRKGKPNLLLQTVDRAGRELFSLRFADTMGSYRAFYYSAAQFHPQRPVVKLVCSKDSCLLVTENSYAGYRWSTGETTPAIKITAPGQYAVFVPAGTCGGFIASESITVTAKQLPRKKKK